MIHIVTDGTIDMPPTWADEYNIHVLPLRLHFGNDSYVQDVDLSRSDFYRLVYERGVIPKTTLPSPQQLTNFYRSIARPADEIISLHISSKLSGTMDIVRSVVDGLHGELKIIAFDSLSGSAALGFMAREARLMERAGCSIQEIIARLTEIRATLAIIFTIDRLDFARMSGRVTIAQNMLSSILSIKPVIHVRDGLLEMGEKVRTRRKALEKVVEQISVKFGNQPVNLAVVHAISPDGAEVLMDLARKKINCCLTWIAELATPVAAHLGPGALGIVAYPVGKELER